MSDEMITRIILYNFLLLCTDAAIIWCLFRRWAFRYLFLSLLSFFLIGSDYANHFASGEFNFLTFIAFVLFVHIPILLFAISFVFRRKAFKTSLAVLAAGILLVAVGVDAFFIEPHWLDVSRTTIATEKIERPVRIVFIADLQTDSITEYEESVLQRALAEKPDIILFGGDYLQIGGRRRWKRLCEEANELLKKCDLKAKHGAFAVQGNVDCFYPWQLMFLGTPVKTVRRTASFDVAGIRLTCLSMDDSFDPELQIGNPSDDGPHAPFHIVMGHSPDYALGDISADLLLAGHTHGGQVQMPGLGAIATMSQIPRRWAAGITELPDGGKLLVSRGIGMERYNSPRIRFFCRPELAVIDIVPKQR